MSAEEHEKKEPAEDLKALEADLASLVPRTDRLDRERLMFMAGQESVLARAGRKGTVPFSLRENWDSPRENWDSPLGRWAWPGAFAVMTAVAATLLVMLLLQPEVPAEIRFVEAPGPLPDEEHIARDESPPIAPPEDRHIEPPPQRAVGPSLLASVGLDWLQLADRGQPRPEASYGRLLEQMLEGGIDDRRLPVSVAGPKDAPAPVPYRELRDRLLGEPKRSGPPLRRPLMHTLFYPGGNS